jgi:hypothetical protein
MSDLTADVSSRVQIQTLICLLVLSLPSHHSSQQRRRWLFSQVWNILRNKVPNVIAEFLCLCIISQSIFSKRSSLNRRTVLTPIIAFTPHTVAVELMPTIIVAMPKALRAYSVGLKLPVVSILAGMCFGVSVGSGRDRSCKNWAGACPVLRGGADEVRRVFECLCTLFFYMNNGGCCCDCKLPNFTLYRGGNERGAHQ